MYHGENIPGTSVSNVLTESRFDCWSHSHVISVNVRAQCNEKTYKHHVLLQKHVLFMFCKKSKVSRVMLMSVYGTEAMKRKRVYDWFKRFRGRN